MTYFRRFMLCLCFIVSLSAQSESLNQLEYITEDAPPYNYREDGELKGIAIDLLLNASILAASPIERDSIKLIPWARAYRSALAGPNKVIFSIFRTPEREKLFKWAGPIGMQRLVLMAKKSRNIELKSLSDVSNFRVGVNRDDAAELYLRNLPLNKLELTLSVSPLQLAKMLQAGRIDMWAGGEVGMREFLAQIGENQAAFEVVSELQVNYLYYAFSRDVDDALVAELQGALDQLVEQP